MSMTFAEPEMLMPLEAAPSLDHLAERKLQIDDAVEVYAREVETGVGTLLGSVQWFDECCRFFLREVLNGNAAKVQAARGAFLDASRERLKLLHRAWALARHAGRVAGHDLPNWAPLSAEVEGLGIRVISLATHWQTVEDLPALTEERIKRRSPPTDMRRLTREQRQEIMGWGAELAEEEYRTNPELLCFEAFGEKDLYDTYPDTAEG